jgi:hypothetical protein
MYVGQRMEGSDDLFAHALLLPSDMVLICGKTMYE